MAWQELVLADMLTERPDGKHLFKQVAIDIPRQNGKGNVIAARQLFGILYGGDKLVIHSAHEFDTAREHFLRLKGYIEESPLLSGKVRKVYDANGVESIVFTNGARLKFKARNNGSGRGFSGDGVWFDEAMVTRKGVFTSLLPALSARKNPQVFYVGSAPVIGPESDEWRKVITDGRKGHSGLYFVEWSAELGADLESDDVLRACNPGEGVTVDIEWCREVERSRLSDDDWGRERFGIWDPEEAKPQDIPADNWKAIQDALATPGDPLSFAVEMTPDRMTASIVAVGPDADGVPVGVVVEHRDRDHAPSWLIPALAALLARDPKNIVIDPKSAAGTLIPDLELAGVTVTECPLRDHIQAAAGLFDAILGGEVKVRPSEPLDAAVSTARRRDVAGSWLWASNPVTPATPLVAFGLAHWGFLQAAESPVNMATQIF